MNKVVKYLIIILGLVLLIPSKMYASSIDIKEVTLDSKSDGVTILSEPEINDLDIDLDLKFSEIGDYVRYKIDIKNNDKEDYTLNAKNELSYFDYEITNKTIKSKNITSVYIKLTLKENVSFKDLDENGKLNLSLQLELKDKKGNIINPKTNDNLYHLLIIFLISIIGIIIGIVLYKNQFKKSKSLLLVLLLIPLIIYATSSTININIKSEFDNTILKEDIPCTVIHKKQDLNSDTYTEVEREVYYGTIEEEYTPLTKTYEGFSKPSSKTIKFEDKTAKEIVYEYKRNKYTFSVSNKTYLDTTSSTEDGTYEYGSTITLVAEDRQGYVFEKWSDESEDQTHTFVLTGDLSIYPIYKERGDTPYQVIHKKMNIDGESYTIVETQNLTGKTNSEIHPAVRNYTGFTSPEVKTTTIASDGSTKVEYLYDRIEYSLNIEDRTYLSDNSTENGNYLYETQIILSALDREGYTFSKWSNNNTNQTLSFGIDRNINIYPIYVANTNTPYTVKHYKMNLDGENYTLAETEELAGTTDENVTPGLKNYEGFTSPSTQTKKIKADGSTLFEYYYTRNKVEVDLDSLTNSEYIDSTLSDGEYYYGKEIKLTAEDKEGYTFTNWSDGETNNPYTFELTEDLNIYPIYTPNTNTPYQVVHYQKDLNADTYTIVETENLSGTTDENVTPGVKTYTGFSKPNVQTKKIKADGSTKFEYYYERKSYTFSISDKTYIDTTSSSEDGTYEYGSEITLTAANRPGYTFTNWSDGSNDNPYTFELTGDLSIYPIYVANANTPYTVKHYKMDLDGENYTLYETENLSGTTDENVTPGLKTYDGFTSPSTQTKKIKGNGSTLIEYYYTRNKYELNITDRSYLSSTSTANGEYYYETPIVLIAIDRDGYTFNRWSNDNTNKTLSFTMSEDVEIYPIYSANNNTAYTVVHKKKDLGSNTYTIAETEELSGTTDTNVTPSVKEYDGFTSPQTQTKKINGDGSTTFEYLYNRKSYTFEISNKTYVDVANTTTDGTYEYGTVISIKAIDRQGYSFEKWSNNNTSQTATFELTSNTSIYPIYVEKGDTPYTVLHKKKDLGSNTYTLADTDELTGKTNAEISPAVKEYTGFISPSVQTTTISSDGSTVVEYLYDRETYTLNITDRTYLSSASTANGEYEYGTPIILSALDREGYTFTNWSDNNTNQTLNINISSDISIYPIYVANTNTVYTVNHRKKDLNSESYTLFETQELTGTTDENVTPAVKSYDHFISPSTKTKKIDGDGSTVFEYLYDRETYTLNITDRTYLSSTSTANGEYEYETPIILSAIDRDGYTFSKWSNDNTSQTLNINISSDISIYPIYTENVITTYRVDLNANGGSVTPTYIEVNIGSSVGTLPTPTNEDTSKSFVGWYTALEDGEEVTSSYKPTGNTEIFAIWSSNTFNYVFNEPNECTFNGTDGVITGENCTYANGERKYIDTGVNLYNAENHDKDYEIGFTIVSYVPEDNVHNATMMNTKLEGNSYPGVVFRRNETTNNLDLSSRKTSGANERVLRDYEGIKQVKIYRIYNEENDVQEIFYSINNGEKILLNDLSEFNPTFNLSVWFGAAPTNASATSAQRYFVGTLKDMYIKLGTYYETKYRVDLNANGGSVSPTYIEVVEGRSVGELPTPTNEDTSKVFAGWYTGLDSGVEVTSSYVPSGNTEIFARWEDVNGYRITFETNGGSSVAAIDLPEGNAIGVLPTSTKDNYTLAGWYLESTLNTRIDDTYVPTGHTKLYAKWVDESYVAAIGENYYASLSNAYNAVTTSDKTTIRVLKDITASQTIASEKDIVIDLQNHKISNASSVIFTNNGTLEVKNGSLEITGTGSTNVIKNNSVATIKNVYITSKAGSGAIDINGSSASLTITDCNIEATGTRQGVYNNGGTLLINGDTYIYNKEQRAAVHTLASGTTTIESGTIESDGNVGAVFVDSGTVIIGKKDGNVKNTPIIIGNNNAAIKVNNNQTLKIYDGIVKGKQYLINDLSSFDDVVNKVNEIEEDTELQEGTETINTYTYKTMYLLTSGYRVTLNPNGGSVTPTFINVIPGNQIGEIPTPTPEDDIHEFAGWYTTIDGVIEVDSTYEPQGNMEIFAHWNILPHYTITFNSNGGSSIDEKNILQGSQVGELPTPTKSLNYFMGWYKDEQLQNVVESTYVPTSNETFYAKWIKTIENANITNTNIELDVDEEETITISNPSDIEEEYTFTSNDTSVATVDENGKVTGVAEGTTTITIRGTTSGKTMQINVKVKITYVTVKFNANGGRSIEDRPLQKGSPIGELPIAYKDHYNFDGWYTSLIDGLPVDNTYRVSSNIEIFARYTAAEEYTITFDANGGTVDEVSRQVTEDMPLGELPTPVRENYYFGGWKDEVENKFYTSNSQPTKDVTLTAQWTEVEKVARINSTYYSSLQNAINAANENDEVVLLVDRTENPTNNKKITINLNNHKVTGKLTNNSNGDLILLNGDIENTSNSTLITIGNYGTLTIGSENPKLYDGVNISSTSTNNDAYGISGVSNSTITMNGGSITATGTGTTSDAYGIYANFNSNSTITINGGSITATSTNSYAYGIYGYPNSTLNVTINGGNITATGNGAYTYGYGICGDSNSTITMNGGSITATGTGTTSFVYGIVGTNITINGGSITATSSDDVYGIVGTNITINGGSITAIGNDDAYGIKGGTNIDTVGPNITINGGSITATSTTSWAYGISRALTSTLNVTINGGSITATSTTSYAYGIVGTNITINGGNIIVTSTSTNSYASGIYGSSNSTIVTMTDGIIYSKGSNKSRSYGIENYKELVLPEGKVLFNETSSDNYEVYYLKGTGNIEVTYNPNGGSVTPSVVYKNAGDTLGTQPVPVLNGHYLDGWYTDPTNGTKVDENTIVNSNVTYYVHYKKSIESMNITNESITLDIGESEQIDITNANEIEEDYIFLSLKPTIATVDENGLVTGVSEGTTSITIRGTTSNKTKTVNVTVEVEENNPISYVNRQVDGEITAGDEIAIDTEHFYVVSSDANETILLSKYNLYVGDIYDVDTSSWKYTRNKTLSNSDSGYGLQKSTAIGAYYPDSGNTAQFIGTVAFSGTNYWDDSVCQNTGKSWSCTGTSGLSSGYTGSYSGNPYPDVYRSNLNTTAPLYNYYYGYGLAQNNGYTISYYVEEYVNKLKQLGAPDTITGRLLLQEEAVNLGCDASASPWSCASSTNNWVYSTSYYLGSALVMNDVWGVTSYGHFGHGEFVDSSDLGVRPVIVISTSDI